MKKIPLLMMVILSLAGMIGCSDATDSLSAETILEPAEIMSKKTEEKEKEGSEEKSTELDNANIGNKTTNSSSAGEQSRQTPSADHTSSVASSMPPPPAVSSEPSKPPEPTVSVYTQKDYDEIIAVVREYAESQTKLNFVWNPALEMNYFCGWHGTPSLNLNEKDGVIRTLKYHVDLTVEIAANPIYGVPSEGSADYNIIWFEEENTRFFQEPGSTIYFVLLYG